MSQTLTRDLESLLLVAAKPLTIRKLAELTGAAPEDVTAALESIAADLNRPERGLQLQRQGQQVALVTSPLSASVVAAFLKDEQSGELTDPAIETLTIVAYRGPVTKADLDQIRGVNCALILRTLLVRGLVETVDDAPGPEVQYQVTLDFLRALGLRSVAELPDYEQLRNDENLTALLGTHVSTSRSATSADVATEGLRGLGS